MVSPKKTTERITPIKGELEKMIWLRVAPSRWADKM